jgi:hypothetical protein
MKSKEILPYRIKKSVRFMCFMMKSVYDLGKLGFIKN